MPYKSPEKQKEYNKEYNRKYQKTKTYKLWRKKYNKQYRQTHRKQIKDSQTQWYLSHKIGYCNQKRRKYLEIKLKIFELLGNKCANPFDIDHGPVFLTDISCLQVDHINGGGTKEKEKFKSAGYYKTILKKIKAGSKDYQLLCANCNWKKRYENNERSPRLSVKP